MAKSKGNRRQMTKGSGAQHQHQRQTHQKLSTARAHRAQLAQENLQICQDGFYCNDGEEVVDIRQALAASIQGTKHYHFSEEIYENITAKRSAMKEAQQPETTEIKVKNQPTMEAALGMIYEARRGANDDNERANNTVRVGILNFASAKHPGGGFVKGAMAQEEHICLTTLLYPCLQQYENRHNHYYQINRQKGHKGLYTDCVIYSPAVPVIRNSAHHELLRQFETVNVVTVPAPNRGVYLKGNRDDEDARKNELETVIDEALKRRIHRALRLFARNNCTDLVLGAFGCGVFGNSPHGVAEYFARYLSSTEFRGCFTKVVFAILTNNPKEDENTAAFQLHMERLGKVEGFVFRNSSAEDTEEDQGKTE